MTLSHESSSELIISFIPEEDITQLSDAVIYPTMPSPSLII
jgi:hypothetical protein